MRTDPARRPESLQRLLLVVAFGEPDAAHDAWLELGPQLDIDTIAHDSHGVFGQLADALRREDPTVAGAQDLLPRLDGVRRRLWTRNSVRLRQVGEAAQCLAAEGIDVSAGGGLGVLLRQHDLSRRPLVDADLVVDGRDASRAEASLRDAGWRPVVTRREGWLRDLRASTLERSGQQLTLRWSDVPWPYATGDGQQPERQASPEPLPVDGIRVPSATALLAWTLVEGHRLWGYTPTRRYADVLMLLRDSEGIDWRHLCDMVLRRNGAGPARAVLAAVASDFPTLVPARSLARLDVGLRDRLSLAVDDRWGTLAVLVRRTEHLPPGRALTSAPAALCDLWGVETRELPAVGLRRLRARTART